MYFPKLIALCVLENIVVGRMNVREMRIRITTPTTQINEFLFFFFGFLIFSLSLALTADLSSLMIRKPLYILQNLHMDKFTII